MTIAARLALGLIGAAIAAGLAPVVWLGFAEGLSGGPPVDAYLLGVVWFTVLQAGLSTLLSLGFAIPVARALAAGRFPGRDLILRIFALPLALPAIVAILGIVTVFGANGWLPLGLYGLTGILIAHVFFNMPLAVRFLAQRLEAVPEESWRLAEQLGFTARNRFALIEWPALAGALPSIGGLIFLLCAASFAVVLTLGGGPQATTLEVAIYQALRFDYDPARAAILALAQLGLCGLLVGLAARYRGTFEMWPSHGLRRTRSRRMEGFDLAVVLAAALFVAAPVAAVVGAGVGAAFEVATISRALATSLAVSLLSGLLSVIVAWPLAAAAQGARRHAVRFAYSSSALLVLIVPPAVMATGWFLLLRNHAIAPILVVAMNALMALPFALSALAPAIAAASLRHDRLCGSLAIRGWARFRLIDLPVLRKPLGLALALSMIVSLGDLTAISLFGSESFVTLPSLIYRQMGNYRSDAAAATALVLTVFCFALITVADRWSRHDDQA